MAHVSEYDYKFVENDSSNFYGIELTETSPWPGVVLVYGTVSIKESEGLDLATLSFTYNIQDPATYEADLLEKDEEFKNYLGDVLSHIIQFSMNEEKNGNSESAADARP